MDISSYINSCWCWLLDIIERGILILGGLQASLSQLDRVEPKSVVMAICDIRVDLPIKFQILLGHRLPQP